MGQEFGVREVPQTTGIIRHLVVRARKMSDPMVRPLVPSKAGGETKQSSPSSLRCGGAFLAPHHRRSVVAARVACFARDRCDLAEDEMLQDGALQFKIRICQGAVRI